MTKITWYNFKVLIVDPDYYARHALYTFLAWDRRTRVMYTVESVEKMWAYLRETAPVEYPDYVLIDANHVDGANGLRALMDKLKQTLPKARIICLAQQLEPELVQAAAEKGARAFLLKHEVGLRVGWAIVYGETRDFTVTSGVAEAMRSQKNIHPRVQRAAILPRSIDFPQLTERVKQALELWLGGMPAYLIADELGIAQSTVRGYIKKAYRILESTVDFEFPREVTQQERAFLRYTALDEQGEA
jgi:DNA-binding NarL/FixJ family response regulator